MRHLISSGSPYEPRIGISRAVVAGHLIAVSGTAPIGPDRKTVGPGDPAAQARRCLEIIAAALEQAGASLQDVVRTRVLLTRIEDWEAVARVHGEFFGEIRPASTVMQVVRFIDPEWLVEIEADAVIEGGKAVGRTASRVRRQVSTRPRGSGLHMTHPDFDTTVKLQLYRLTAESGAPPSAEALAAALAVPVTDVLAAWSRLQQQRLLLLTPDGSSIRMAPPFSGVPTQHRVTVDGISYFANCAWDALGIPAALHRPGRVRSRCEDSLEPLDLPVGLEGPEPSTWLFHCLVPAAQWWDDLVFT